MKQIDPTDKLKRIKRLALHVWRHFRQDRCFEEAASLGYTSLLALVPLLAVIFGVASAFPVFDRWAGELQSFIFDNFIPTSGEQIQTYITGFLGSVRRLTLPGTFLLILTALLLMMRIEKAFNRIWRVPVPRSLVNRIVMYWAVLTLGPLALGAATALSAQPALQALDISAGDGGGLRSVSILILTWAAFTLVFLLVPNRSVKLRHAAIGALLSALLFSLAKTAFVAFVSRASFNVIYGTLATIPIFLFWMYLVWVVVLLGASLAASLTTFNERRGEWRWPWEWEFLLAFRLVGHLWLAQRDGRSMSQDELWQAEEGIPDSLLQRLLGQFFDAGIVTQDQQDNWLLTRDLESFSLLDLYQAGHFHLPLGKKPELPRESDWDGPFLEAISVDSLNMSQPLKAMYKGARQVN
ncbi:MAG: YihY family inner membrane protein [Xanthomonadales bacterium]|nr:YihY family inner membrane protein [Gammaproteobacteria bacterium]NNE06395.1 YihY family inner membrane protein [Xanthomonadales bacterium]NNL94910.1 YihY family inner membrane protein [Xanthomonadales bacterium]